MFELLKGLKEIILVRGDFCQSTTSPSSPRPPQEIVARNIHFAVSKLYISCQYKLVICSAVLPFPTQNTFGRTQTALVILTEEALKVLPLIAFLLFVTGIGT